MVHIDPERVARARAAAAIVAPLAPVIEASRRLPEEAIAALTSAGVWKLLVPKAYGGAEASASTLLAVIDEVARADGSAGWCVMIAATSGLMSAYLDDEVARAAYGDDGAITSGVFAPMGRAIREGDGYRVSGRWPFASGCEHAAWRMGGVLLDRGDDGGPDLLPSGAPHVRSVLFRAAETRVIDTWQTSGLRGTGSHDVEVNDVHVPASRCFSLFTPPSRHDAAIYRVPFFGVLAAGVAAVSLGIARASIDALVELARGKRGLGSKRSIAHRELVQLRVAQAEAKVRGARALLFDAIGELEARVAAGAEAKLRDRAVARLAASHAASESAAAVDLMYEAGGATSIYASHPLQRHFRDVHVATQHVMVSPTATTLAGRVLLGVESDTSTL